MEALSENVTLTLTGWKNEKQKHLQMVKLKLILERQVK